VDLAVKWTARISFPAADVRKAEGYILFFAEVANIPGPLQIQWPRLDAVTSRLAGGVYPADTLDMIREFRHQVF
jgi:hypothetical protein